MSQQLPLQVSLHPDAHLSSLYAGDNQWFVEWVSTTMARPPTPSDSVLSVCVTSVPGAGLTYMLQAICRFAEEHGQGAFYASLQELAGEPPELLDGLEQMQCLCLDDADAVLGQPGWDEALFNLYNRMQALGHRLFIGLHRSWRDLQGHMLPDLHSRLAAGLQVSLKLPGDDWPQAVHWLASQRGLHLPPDVARYLAERGPRDWRAMAGLLVTLDTRALAAKRRLTIPFIRQALGW